MSRRAQGSNQYVSRNLASVPVTEPDLISQAQPTLKARCGEVWGTHCQAWVQPPKFSHGLHGIRTLSVGELVPHRMGADCPQHVLKTMASNGTHRMRVMVAKHSNTPPEVFRQLAVDPQEDVRSAVAHNRRCPPDVLGYLANDAHPRVRESVAAHPNTPADTLVQMLADNSPDVRMLAQHNDSLPEEYRRLIPLQPNEW
jgi:hypothetical protein